VTIADLARTPRLLVALDFDGTLAPLVDEPMTARMTPAAASAVEALLTTPDTIVAFVSGRTLEDLRVIAEHDDSSPVLLAGSHGAQWWLPPHYAADAGRSEPAEQETAVRDELRHEAERLVSHIPGAWIEPKTFGFGVHSRLVAPAQKAETHRRVDELMATRAPRWRRREGHAITEYAFRHEGKDTAVARLRELTGASAVLFAGDDVTDEDAIASLGPGDLGVRVGAGQTSAAVRVTDMAELADLLHELAERRATASASAV
jgi:trehalose 6-phosphate phosphatase